MLKVARISRLQILRVEKVRKRLLKMHTISCAIVLPIRVNWFYLLMNLKINSISNFPGLKAPPSSSNKIRFAAFIWSLPSARKISTFTG